MGTAFAVSLTVRILLAGVGLSCAAPPQGLPPGILLLSRVKVHMRQELARLPNCSCLETVRRDYQAAGGTMHPLDTIRLEVLYSDRNEYYASPGERHFTENHPSAFAASGTSGNGHFALFLSEVVGEGRLSYQYKGEELLHGRTLARFDYRIPASVSGHTITVNASTGTVGIAGSFWADPATYDIVRIAMEAEDIPPELPIRSSMTSINYAHTNLGGIDFLLPQSGESRLVKFTGEDSWNHIEFTHCRLFEAQTSISFGSSQGFPQFARVPSSK